MRQLLLWCGQKAVKNTCKSSVNNDLDPICKSRNARIKASVFQVQQRILKDLASKKINTSWYHRPATIPDKKELLSHPGNTSNAKQLIDYKLSIDRLEKEKAVWETLVHDRTRNHQETVQSLNSENQLRIEIEKIQESLSDQDQELLAKSQDISQLDSWISITMDDLLLEVEIFGTHPTDPSSAIGCSQSVCS